MITPEMINDMLAQHWPVSNCVCIEVGAKYAIASITPEASDYRPGGYISGPTLFAAADAALWFLIFGASERIEPHALTSDLTIRFLHPSQGKTVFARVDLNKVSKRSIVGTVTIWTDTTDNPIEIVQGTYILP